MLPKPTVFRYSDRRSNVSWRFAKRIRWVWTIPDHAWVRGVATALSALSLLFHATAIFAGTICGTVTDAVTGSRVNKAGIFVRTTSGEYTGLYGATDAIGEFCIDEVPAGVYDLEVR